MSRVCLFNLTSSSDGIPDRLLRMIEELFQIVRIDAEFRVWIFPMTNPVALPLGLSGALIGKPHRSLPVRPVSIPMIIRPEERIESVRILDIEVPASVNAEDFYRLLVQALEQWQNAHH